MRADRLISLLLLLQRRGRVTASEVAAELEISERTARRDLEALAMSGVPVYSRHGRGGGWQLIGGATTNLSGLSSDEARALFLAVGPSAADNRQLRAALQKLGSAIPETFRADAEAAAMAVKIDPNGWGTIGSSVDVPHLHLLTSAVVERRQIQLAYSSPRSGPSNRVVHPLGLVTKRDVWYLVADTDPAGHPEGLRTFRLSRIDGVTVLDAPSRRPPDFDLEAVWNDIVIEVRSLGDRSELELRVAPELLASLQWQFRDRVTTGDSDERGWVTAQISEIHVTALAGALAGYGAGIELVEPPSGLVDELRRITSELVERYGSG